MKSLYLLVNLGAVLVPFLFSFHPKIKFHKHFPAVLPAIGISGLLFLIWDFFYTQAGIWGFNPAYLSERYIFNLPIEEVLFFICIPFSCVFTYHCLTTFYPKKISKKAEDTITISLIALLGILGLLFYFKAYTAATFISTACLLYLFRYKFNVSWLGKLYKVYPWLLIPFFIVNGILTGTGIENEIVWYNDSENLGIRLLTIPVEDVFYGFELIMLNIFFFEKLRAKTSLSVPS